MRSSVAGFVYIPRLDWGNINYRKAECAKIAGDGRNQRSRVRQRRQG